VPLAATDIHICSNYLPDKWWSEKTRFDSDAIYRRIAVVHWHYEFKKIRRYESDTPGQIEGCAMRKFLEAWRVENPIYVNINTLNL